MTNEIYTTQNEEQVTTVTTETETTETTETETTDIVIDATPTKDSTNAVSSGGVYDFAREQLYTSLSYKGARKEGVWLYHPGTENAIGDVHYVPEQDKYYALMERTTGGWKELPLLTVAREVINARDIVNNVKDSMFRAVGDGIEDDTDAIQAALDAGGIVYFPAGRYRVTKELKATTPCTIVMERMYPSCDDEDYPINGVVGTHFGARIETYLSSGCGLLIGDGVNVDGLAIRAMSGFQGIVLKYDGEQGKRTYPSQTRLKHIRVDCASETVCPEAMFDFNPHRTYGVIVEDVIIGTNHATTYAQYGWRTVLTKWANSIHIENVIIDIKAPYPMDIDNNGFQAMNWVMKNISIRAYEKSETSSNASAGDPYWIKLKGLTQLYISGCHLRDVDETSATDSMINTSSLQKVTAIGNDDYFNALDTVTDDKIAQLTEANSLVLEEMKAASYASLARVKTGCYVPAGINRLNPRSRDLTNAFTTNADNNGTQEALYAENDGQFIPCDFKHDGCVNNALLSLPTEDNSAWFKEGMWTPRADYWTTALIPCGFGDVVRFYYYGDHEHWDEDTEKYVSNTGDRKLALRKGVAVCEYDGTGANCLRWMGNIANGLSENEYTVVSPNAEFIRVSFYDAGMYPVVYEDRADYIMATVNHELDVSAIQQRQGHAGKDAANYSDDTEWENISGIARYTEQWYAGISMQGDPGQLILTSPDGTEYRMTVSNEGELGVEPLTTA